MALTRKLAIALATLLVITSASFVNGGLLDSLTCPFKDDWRVDACNFFIRPLITAEAFFEENPIKFDCCTAVVTANCARWVYGEKCGTTSGDFRGIVEVIGGGLAGEKCRNYNTADKCTQPGNMFIVAVVYLLVLCVILSMCLCCCGGRRRRRY